MGEKEGRRVRIKRREKKRKMFPFRWEGDISSWSKFEGRKKSSGK